MASEIAVGLLVCVVHLAAALAQAIEEMWPNDQLQQELKAGELLFGFQEGEARAAAQRQRAGEQEREWASGELGEGGGGAVTERHALALCTQSPRLRCSHTRRWTGQPGSPRPRYWLFLSGRRRSPSCRRTA